jgi:hypothetical protein
MGLPRVLVAFFVALSLLGKSRFPFASISSEGSSSPSVVLGHEEVTNGEEIVGKLLLMRVFDVCVGVLNHVECCAMFFERTFKELEAESCKSVTIGDHHFFYMTSLDLVQKGEKTLAFEVEPGANVLDDAVVLGTVGSETGEITRGLLVGRGNPSVEDDLALGNLGLFSDWLEAKTPANILVVIAMKTSGVLWRDGTNESLSGPASKGLGCDVEFCTQDTRGNVRVLFVHA